jgi:hypothetical protein
MSRIEPEQKILHSSEGTKCSRCSEEMPQYKHLITHANQLLCITCVKTEQQLLSTESASLTGNSQKYRLMELFVIEFTRLKKLYEEE